MSLTAPPPTASGILAKLLVGLSLNGELDIAQSIAEPWRAIVLTTAIPITAEGRRTAFGTSCADNGATEDDMFKIFKSINRVDPAKDVPSPWGFTVQTAPELMAQEFTPLRFLVPGLVPEGCMLVVGSPKTGKSTILLSMSYGIALGGAVLGKIKVPQADVLYFALEDGPRRVQRRLSLLSGGQAIPPSLMFSYVAPSIKDGMVAGIERFLDAHPKVGVVIVDTLAKARGQNRRDKDSGYQQDYEEGAPFTELAMRRRISLLLTHHTRKAISPDPMDMINATQGLAASVDNVLVLQRERFGGDARLSIMGRDVEEETEVSLSWDSSLKNYILAGNAKDVQAGKERMAVLRAVSCNRLMTIQEIAASSGRTVDSSLRMLLSRMVNDGTLSNPERGRYLLRARMSADDDGLCDPDDL